MKNRAMRNLAAWLCLAGSLPGLPACQRPAEQAGYKLTGKIFVFNYRIAQATYMLTLNRQKGMREGLHFTATFENPTGGLPYILQRPIFAAQDRLVIESPAIECVRKGRPYKVGVVIFDSAGIEVEKLETTVTSDLDQSVLPLKPLVIGPAYQRNPEAYDAEGNIVMRSIDTCPK